MSENLLKRVLWTALPAHLKLTAAVMAHAANETGYAEIEIEQIAVMIGQTKRQAKRHTDELQRLGLVTPIPYKNHQRGQLNQVYQIHIDALGRPPPDRNRIIVGFDDFNRGQKK